MRSTMRPPNTSRRHTADMMLIDISDGDQQESQAGNQETESNEDQFLTNDFVDVAKDQESEEDETVAQQDKAVVLIMGVTGAGKSSFISLLADQDVEVGHSLESSTVDIGLYSFGVPGDKTIFLVDTPGFDDTKRPDVDILKDISFFLTKLHEERWRLAGVVYMHRITDPRISGTSMKNLQMFQKLCGTASMPLVVLATTMWSALGPNPADQQIGKRRQDELQQHYWAPMISSGAKVMAHDGTVESARAIVSAITGQNSGTVLDIVREMVYENKTLLQTEVGRFVQDSADEAKKKFDREILELQSSMEEAMEENDREAQEAISEERDKATAKIREEAQKVEEMNVSIQQLAQERQPQFERLVKQAAGNPASRPAQSTAAAIRERHIRELEISLQEMERRHREALARQQLLQQSQTTSQLQNIRIMVEQSARQRQELQRQLDYERRQRKKEQGQWNPLAILAELFSSGPSEPRRSRGRERRHHSEDEFGWY